MRPQGGSCYLMTQSLLGGTQGGGQDAPLVPRPCAWPACLGIQVASTCCHVQTCQLAFQPLEEPCPGLAPLLMLFLPPKALPPSPTRDQASMSQSQRCPPGWPPGGRAGPLGPHDQLLRREQGPNGAKNPMEQAAREQVCSLGLLCRPWRGRNREEDVLRALSLTICEAEQDTAGLAGQSVPPPRRPHILPTKPVEGAGCLLTPAAPLSRGKAET